MDIAEPEAIACLKVLVAMTKADGKIHDAEKKSLAGALEAFEVPAGLTIDALLAETVDVDAELAKIASAEGRAQAYRSAFFLAYADGACSKEEQALLERVAAATQPTAADRESLARLAPANRGVGFVAALRGLFRAK